MITYSIFGRQNSSNQKVVASLTEQGKQYAVSEPYVDITAKVIDVILGIEHFKEITGLKPISETETIVEYSVEFTDITPFGEVMGSKPEVYTLVSTFSKFDDGWRIEKTTKKR